MGARIAKRNLKWEKLRKRASEVFDERALHADSWSEADILHLIHELEVHQIKLETQGEELNLKNQELKELLHRYAELYHRAPTGFISLNNSGVIVESNQAASEMLGLPRASLKHRGFSRFIYSLDQQKYLEFLSELNKIPRGKARGELRLLRDLTEPFYVHIEMAPLKNDRCEIQGWLVAFIDISPRKRAEEALQEACRQLEESRRKFKGLSARLLSVQEEERRRIARELHDSFGQTLAAMKFSIENAIGENRMRDPEESFRLLGQFIPIIQDAIVEVRNIYTGLRPTILDDLGIIATIEWFCREFRAVFPNLRVETVTMIKEEDVPETLKIVIFRIIQEALNNAARHSQAEWVNLSLVRGRRGVNLTIEDNGIGFDVKALAQDKELEGMGLAGMKERAELSGGTLFVESTTGHGTRIRATWDIRARQVITRLSGRQPANPPARGGSHRSATPGDTGSPDN
jgi:PAS domain S-box-containing protein